MSDQQRAAEAEVIAAIVASAITKRFDVLVGEPNLYSAIVLRAALESTRVLFGPTDNPLLALDEVERLEETLGGGDVETVT